MTEPTNQNPDEASDASSTDRASAGPPDENASTASNIIESIRDAVDDLAERAAPVVKDLSAKAGPAVKEFSAKAAEVAAVAADKAAPFVRRAGEATADASGKLAEKSRGWASDVRSNMAGGGTAADAADSAAEKADAAADVATEATDRVD